MLPLLTGASLSLSLLWFLIYWTSKKEYILYSHICIYGQIYNKKQITTGWKKVLLYSWDFYSCFIPLVLPLSHEDTDGCWVQLFKKFPFPLSSWQEISGVLTWTVFCEEPTECIFGSMNAIWEEKIQIADCGRKHLRVLDAQILCEIMWTIVKWNSECCQHLKYSPPLINIGFCK